MKSVLIFCTEVLPFTQTFVVAQAASLKHFDVSFVGLAQAKSNLEVSFPVRLLTADHSWTSRMRRGLYKYSGIAPGFHRAVGDMKPDLIHAHFAEAAAIALPLAQYLDVPLIVTLHGSIEPIPDKQLLRSQRGRIYLMRRRNLWRSTSLFLCVSQFIWRKACEAGYPEEKLHVHYIGVDRSAFSPNLVGCREPLVLFVGRLAEKKGCEYLIRAMSRVQNTYPDTRVVVIGDGPLRSGLEHLSAELGVRCSFLGSQPASVITRWLARARVFCAPSVAARDGNSEGLGMVFLEAQACGTPVVSFNHGGIPEAVAHEQTGLLAPERREDVLAECIERYLRDDVFWRAAQSAAVRRVEERFDLVTQTEELERIYEQVLTSSYRRGPGRTAAPPCSLSGSICGKTPVNSSLR